MKRFYIGNVTYKSIRINIKSQFLSWVSTDRGNVRNVMEKGKREVRHASLPCSSHFDHQSQILNWISLLQPSLLTQLLCLAFFVSSCRVHLDLQTLCLHFLFSGFFLWFSIYCYPYFFQGPRLSCWEPFCLYLHYLSAKVKQFGQTSFFILQQEI